MKVKSMEVFFKEEYKAIDCLKFYYKIVGITPPLNCKDLLIYISNIKENLPKREKLPEKFNEKFAVLIENILKNIQEKDITNITNKSEFYFDGFVLLQLITANLLLKNKKIESKEVTELELDINKNTALKIIDFIEKIYGESSYSSILSNIGLLDVSAITSNSKTTIFDAASTLIINMHPQKLNEEIYTFLLNNYNRYNYTFPKLNESNFDSIKNNLRDINIKLLIIMKIEKEKCINKYEVFKIFENKDSFLPYVNSALNDMNLGSLKSLSNIDYQDIQLLKDMISNLKSNNKKLEKELKDNYNLIKVLTNNIKTTQEKLDESNSKLKEALSILNKLEKRNEITLPNNKITNQTLNPNTTENCNILNNAHFYEKIVNIFFHNACKKLEDYFFYSIDEQKIRELKMEAKINKKNKAELILIEMKKKYPNIFNTFKNQKVDLEQIILAVDAFRKSKNYELNNDPNSDYSFLIEKLSGYLNNGQNLLNPLKILFNFFDCLNDYVFQPNYKLKFDLINYFKDKNNSLCENPNLIIEK